MARSFSKNNVLAGLFVILSLVLAVFLAVLVSGAQKLLIPTNAYTVRFTLADGTAGLKMGSVVNVGGQEVGRVTSIDFDRPSPEAMPTGVKVNIVVRKSVTLFTDSAAFLERPLLGSMGSINIIRAAKAEAPGTPLAPGSQLAGMIAPPSFLAQAGFGPEQANQIQKLFARATDVADRVDRMSAKLEQEFEPALKSVRSAADDIADVTGRLRGKAPQWSAQIDTLFASAQSAADDTKHAIHDIQAGIDANRPGFDRAIANMEALTKNVREETVPAINAAVGNLQKGSEDFKGGFASLNATLREQEPNLRRSLANFRLASDQIKLASVEIRRSPWRLLYAPKTKELESELFYNAARAYAEAVSDLRAASESLESSTKGAPGDTTPLDGKDVQAIQKRLDEAFKRYDEAEKVLLQKMTDKTP
jgi:ABC-type transporter Mla subunit MlaD